MNKKKFKFKEGDRIFPVTNRVLNELYWKKEKCYTISSILISLENPYEIYDNSNYGTYPQDFIENNFVLYTKSVIVLFGEINET